jgi:hypothetical protein
MYSLTERNDGQLAFPQQNTILDFNPIIYTSHCPYITIQTSVIIHVSESSHLP